MVLEQSCNARLNVKKPRLLCVSCSHRPRGEWEAFSPPGTEFLTDGPLAIDHGVCLELTLHMIDLTVHDWKQHNAQLQACFCRVPSTVHATRTVCKATGYD